MLRPDMESAFLRKPLLAVLISRPAEVPDMGVGPPDHFPSVCSECIARAADMPECAPPVLRFRERL